MCFFESKYKLLSYFWNGTVQVNLIMSTLGDFTEVCSIKAGYTLCGFGNTVVKCELILYKPIVYDWNPKLTTKVLTLYGWTIKPRLWYSHCTCKKGPSIQIHLKDLRQVCLLATNLTRQKFEQSCVPKPLKAEEAPVHMDSQMAWKTWTVRPAHFADRIGLRLATFTTVNLTANASYAKVPRCAVAISYINLTESLCLSPGPGAVWQKKALKAGESVHGSGSSVRETKSQPAKITDISRL